MDHRVREMKDVSVGKYGSIYLSESSVDPQVGRYCRLSSEH